MEKDDYDEKTNDMGGVLKWNTKTFERMKENRLKRINRMKQRKWKKMYVLINFYVTNTYWFHCAKFS